MLIMTHSANQNPEDMVMVDDGTGLDVAIPTVMIGRADGEKIKKAIVDTENANKDAKNKKEYVVLLVNFEMENPDDRVEYDFWYTSGDTVALQFIKAMKEYNDKLGSNALFTPHMIVRTCRNCDENDINCLNFGGELYCAAFTRNDNVLGRKALKLGVDEMCIHDMYRGEENAARWWRYMENMLNCIPSHFSDSCVAEALNGAGIDAIELARCRNREREIIRAQQAGWATSKIPYSPAVIINNRVYRVTLPLLLGLARR